MDLYVNLRGYWILNLSISSFKKYLNEKYSIFFTDLLNMNFVVGHKFPQDIVQDDEDEFITCAGATTWIATLT